MRSVEEESRSSQPQTNALDLTFIDDYAYAQYGPVIQKRRLARPAGVADLKRSGRKMTVAPHILDLAFAKLESFGPDLGLPEDQRLRKEFPHLAGSAAEEVLRQVSLVSKTVWSLAERGGEAKMKNEEITAELQRAHPFLRDSGLKQALFLVNYYACHEGYDK